MSLYSQFKTSKVSETEGIIVRFKANDDGTIPYFRIGRAGRSNSKWSKVFEAKTRAFKDQIDDGSLSEVDATRINVETFVEGLLYEFGNIQDESGKVIEYNNENAVKLFNDLPDLLEALDKKSKEIANFLESKLNGDSKN